MQRLEKRAQEAIERAQKMLESHPELNDVMRELDEAYGLLETALNPGNDADSRMNFDCFIPQVYSDEYGSEDFGVRVTFQDALAVLERVQARESDVGDGVDREYLIRCI